MWDVWSAAAPQVQTEAMTAALTGWRGPHMSNPNTWDYPQLIMTYGPAIAGALGSKYVGGPKGLYVNASLRDVPFIKL
ncbi:unnamed protein product [marine sediment metagenome]|uniref:Uncharacterized protein n=1 Tax=marine sediment metagenome TaxID=412755 RepID=X1VPJ3_9ZZZZ